MSASAHRYSCDQLGACQSRSTPCHGCDHATRRVHSRAHQRRALMRWIWRSAALAALAIVIVIVSTAAVLTAL